MEPFGASPALAHDRTVYFPAGAGLHAIRPDGTALWQYGRMFSFFPRQPWEATDDGTIYFAADRSLHAVHPDGTRKWVLTAEGPFAGGGPIIGPDGALYLGARDHFFYAIHPDGTLKWKFATGGPITAAAILGAEGGIYFGSSDHWFYALDSNGLLQWKFETKGEIRSAPVMTPDGVLCFGSDDGNVYFVRGNATLGQSPWPMFKRDPAHSGRSGVQPLLPNSPSFVTASKDTVRGAVRVDWGTALWAQSYDLWRATANDPNSAVIIATNIAGTNTFNDLNVGFGTTYYYWVQAKNSVGSSTLSSSDFGYQTFKRWEFSASGAIRADPAVAPDGTVYVATSPLGLAPTTNQVMQPELYALTPAGSLKWRINLDHNVLGAPSIAPDGTIYCVTAGGKLYALNADGAEKWNFSVQGRLQFSPALAPDGTVYLGGGDKRFYAIRPDGTLFWEFTASAPVGSPAVIGPDDTVYFATSSELLHALDANGSVKWRTTLDLACSRGPPTNCRSPISICDLQHGRPERLPPLLYPVAGVLSASARNNSHAFRKPACNVSQSSSAYAAEELNFFGVFGQSCREIVGKTV